MDITPSNQQALALAAIKDWYKNRRAEQQVFRLFGFAGTGKTTITKLAIAELNLKRVEFAAYTGKAALVMTRAGTPASTIHSLAYKYVGQPSFEIGRLNEQIVELEQAYEAEQRVTHKATIQIHINRLRRQIGGMLQPGFALDAESPIADCDLLVLDECSMIDEQMARDLLSFEKPILVLGDPGQLPPVKGGGAFTEAKPDVMLTEIHRQAADSPILQLATQARLGRPLSMGVLGPGVGRVPRHEALPQRLLGVDQVICGYNRTRITLNLAMRQVLGLSSELPTGHEQDKIIILRNWHKHGLLNGQFVRLTVPCDHNAKSFRAELTTDEGDPIAEGRSLPIYAGHFDDHLRPDPDRERRDYNLKQHMVEATWGYAITCHKAQGSQWPKVAIVDDGFAKWKPAERARWLYTAVTRAQEQLVIYG